MSRRSPSSETLPTPPQPTCSRGGQSSGEEGRRSRGDLQLSVTTTQEGVRIGQAAILPREGHTTNQGDPRVYLFSSTHNECRILLRQVRCLQSRTNIGSASWKGPHFG
ncbi:hypothetical protein AV530_000678 [Patagioenas fasciata monilis]|uniref:Uncharacterized protein n=1 Tax=Patagioenas fasciata monilis TaxID=372326 RepID=A0A1V4IG69_PATFA|nr:hypothetical protein AV530_000678 [Patagioenas fasciata monilis]